MTKSNKEINPGGVNGTGTGEVDVNSDDYKGLQATIREHAEKQTAKEKMGCQSISFKKCGE